MSLDEVSVADHAAYAHGAGTGRPTAAHQPAWSPNAEHSLTSKAMLHAWSQQRLTSGWATRDLQYDSEHTALGWVCTLRVSGRHWGPGAATRACRSQPRATKRQAEQAAASVAILSWQCVAAPGVAAMAAAASGDRGPSRRGSVEAPLPRPPSPPPQDGA